MWKKPKKKKVLAPVSEALKKMREEGEKRDQEIYDRALEKFNEKGHRKSQS